MIDSDQSTLSVIADGFKRIEKQIELELNRIGDRIEHGFKSQLAPLIQHQTNNLTYQSALFVFFKIFIFIISVIVESVSRLKH